MTNNTNTPNLNPGKAWPDSPEIAIMTAGLFQKLGGNFSISSNGNRYAGRPMPYLFADQGEGLPQLPVRSVSGLFHSEDEWQGAIKLLDYILHELSQNDRDLIYFTFAPVALDERKPFDFRELLS